LDTTDELARIPTTDLSPVAPLPFPGSAGDRCLIMGILNVTPDSFSDGQRYLAVSRAVDHGIAMSRAGADIVDVGGESTRPGATRVPASEELRRVLPVVRTLAQSGVRVSIDTMRARVASAAVAAGATVVNDVSGGLADRAMARAVAATEATYIAMHWRAHSVHMQKRAFYNNVVEDVREALLRRADALVGVGIDPGRLVLDPGLGFAKDAEHNWSLLRGLDRIINLGQPVLIGASRKSFLGQAAAMTGRASPAPADRDHLTAAVTALAAAAGVACVRVHDVSSSRAAITIATAWKGRTDGGQREG
jgi:dihydropteroate synthase